MKEKKEVRNQVSKKGFVEKYEEITQALKKVIIIIAYVIISFPLFTAGSYYVTGQLIGEGLYTYSEEAYNNMKVILSYDIVENVGIDTYHMINATGLTVKKIMWFGKDNVSEEELSTIEYAITKGIIPTEDLETKVIDEYNIIYEDGKIMLCCEKRIGEFFTARITQEMDSNFNAISSTRNYEFEEEYANKFQFFYGACMIGGAIVAWILFTAFLSCIVLIVATIIKKYIEKKDEIEDSIEVCEELNKVTEA